MDRIGKIRFEGNLVTKEATMRLEMTVHEGDPVDLKKIEASVQHIMDLGIFIKVSYYLEKAAPDQQTTLVIVVKEPYYWYILPTFRLNDNSQLELGGRLRWNNVLGYNHRLLFTAADKGTKGGVKQYAGGISYTMPRFLLSRHSLSLNYSHEQLLYDNNILGDQRETRTSYGINMRKWLNPDGISSGLYYGLGLGYSKQTNQAVNPADISDGNFDRVIYGFQFGKDDMHKYEFQRGGKDIDYGISLSSGFVQQTLTYKRYNILNKLNVTNLNYLISFGYANKDVLGNKAFSLGGNSTLRGYQSGRFEGNVFYRASIEYLTKFHRSPLVRKAVFIDLGDVQNDVSGFRPSSVKVGTGAGLRWKAQYFVNVDIRLDIAYGIQSHAFRLVLGSSNTF